MCLKKRQSSQMGRIALEVYIRRKQPLTGHVEQVDDFTTSGVPDMDYFRRGFKFYTAAVLFKVPFGLIRQSHATVMAVSNNQQLGPFFVIIPLIRGRMVFYFFFFFFLSFLSFFFFLAIRASFLFSKAV